MTTDSFYLDGNEMELAKAAPIYAGAALLDGLGAGVKLPGPEEPPYLFCSNGSCRDCNLLVDGLADVACCRLFLVPGMSLRSGEGAGEENALSRRLGLVPTGAPLAADVAVVGAGTAGRAAAAAAREIGVETVLLEARSEPIEAALSSRPVGVVAGEPFVMERRTKRILRSRSLVLANGARDAEPRVPGSTLPGVLPLTLLDRYVALGCLPGKSILIAGESEIREEALFELGATSCTILTDARAVAELSGRNRVERARVHRPGKEGSDLDLEVDLVFLRPRREPALEIARSLGCRWGYDRELGYDRLVTGENGATSRAGIFACGDVVGLGTTTDSEEAGRLAGRAAALRSQACARSEC